MFVLKYFENTYTKNYFSKFYFCNSIEWFKQLPCSQDTNTAVFLALVQANTLWNKLNDVQMLVI